MNSRNNWFQQQLRLRVHDETVGMGTWKFFKEKHSIVIYSVKSWYAWCEQVDCRQGCATPFPVTNIFCTGETYSFSLCLTIERTLMITIFVIIMMRMRKHT